MERVRRSKRLAGGKSRQVSSPQEIEEEIKSIKTVAWDPFTVLPKEIYLEIFEKLDNSVDKQNFMNAHHKFCDLFKSNRTLFLFQQVFKVVAKREEDEEIDEDSVDVFYREFENYQQCRLVCRDWDNGLQDFFQLHDTYFKLGGCRHYLTIWKLKDDDEPPCRRFIYLSTNEAEKDLEMFSVTHPPSRNPFFSKSITLMPFTFFRRGGLNEEEVERIMTYRKSIDALLDRYAKHIWHCKIRVSKEELDLKALKCIVKWLSLMPELKTLTWNNGEGSDSFSKNNLKEIDEHKLVQPEFKKLVFLVSEELPALVFNKLFGNLKGLQKIRLEFSYLEESLRNFKIDRENLVEAYLPIKGLEDFEYLDGSESFPSLKKLITTLEFEKDEKRKDKPYPIWPEWKMIFKIVEEKFPALNNLTLILPQAISDEDNKRAIEQSLECRLNLPKLEKLWINLPNPGSIDFLLPCKALKEMRVVLDHSKWDVKMSRDMKRNRRSEKIKFNMDFEKMWESNIWKAFPKLCKLKILAWHERGHKSDTGQFIYERNGENRKYSKI